MSLAPHSFALHSLALWRSAPLRSALLRSACPRSALGRLAILRLDLLRSPLHSEAPRSLASVRSVFCKDASGIHTCSRSAFQRKALSSWMYLASRDRGSNRFSLRNIRFSHAVTLWRREDGEPCFTHSRAREKASSKITISAWFNEAKTGAFVSSSIVSRSGFRSRKWATAR